MTQVNQFQLFRCGIAAVLSGIFAMALASCGGSGGNSPPRSGQSPAAQPDTATTDQGAAVQIDVLANDSGLGDGPVTVSIVGNPMHGTALVNNDNSITYTPSIPNSTYLGEDGFIYQVTDQDGDTSQASVSLTVQCPAAPCQRLFETSWNAVNHPDQVGYCLYHDIQSGPPYQDRICVGNVTSFDWSLPVNTGTDIFSITSIDGAGNESPFSAEVVVTSF